MDRMIEEITSIHAIDTCLDGDNVIYYIDIDMIYSDLFIHSLPSIAITETNRLRISMGLKPLVVQDPKAKEQEKQKQRDEAEKQQRSNELQEKVQK